MRLVINPKDCIGCHECEKACIEAHKNLGNVSKPLIKIFEWKDKKLYFPNTCAQCNPAPCMEACPANAMYRDPNTDAVLINQDRCIRCRLCLSACPFGAIDYDTSLGMTVKCDLCGGNPACVKACPTNALKVVKT